MFCCCWTYASLFVRKNTANSSFPWFSRLSHIQQVWGLLFSSHHNPGLLSTQAGCSASPSGYKTWAVKFSSTAFFSWRSFSYDSAFTRWTEICLEPTSRFILSVVFFFKNWQNLRQSFRKRAVRQDRWCHRRYTPCDSLCLTPPVIAFFHKAAPSNYFWCLLRSCQPPISCQKAEFRSFCALSQSPWLTGFLRCVHPTATVHRQPAAPPSRPRSHPQVFKLCSLLDRGMKIAVRASSTERNGAAQATNSDSSTPQYMLLPSSLWDSFPGRNLPATSAAPFIIGSSGPKIIPDPQAQRVEGRGCFFSSAHIIWIQMVSPQGGKPSHPKPKFYSRNCSIHYMYHFNLVPSCFECLHLLTTLSIGFLTYLCSSLLCHPRNKCCCFSSSV